MGRGESTLCLDLRSLNNTQGNHNFNPASSYDYAITRVQVPCQHYRLYARTLPAALLLLVHNGGSQGVSHN